MICKSRFATSLITLAGLHFLTGHLLGRRGSHLLVHVDGPEGVSFCEQCGWSRRRTNVVITDQPT